VLLIVILVLGLYHYHCTRKMVVPYEPFMGNILKRDSDVSAIGPEDPAVQPEV